MFRKLLIKALAVTAFTSLTANSFCSTFSTNTTKYEQHIQEDDLIELLKDEVRYTQNWDEGCEDHTIQLTQYEAYLIMSIASTEALNQGKLGMLMVMETIINRKNNPLFPDTVYGVISQPGQFSSFSSGAYLTAEITPEVHMALAELEMNKNLDNNPIAFESGNNGYSLLSFFDFYMKCGDHVFYKLKKD